jgi:hypothetical protein
LTEESKINDTLFDSKANVPRHAIAWVVLCVIGALLFVESYQRWGHPIIDLGRDLYLPSQILAGHVLYRELLYNYGPTIPYLLAGITAVFGDALWVFESVGIVIGVAALVAVYAIGVRLGGWTTGFAAALMFLIFSFFANTTWGCNFVLPYSYSATLGTATALWSFYFLHVYLYGNRSAAPLVWSVFFLIITLLTKHEIGLSIGLVHALAWWAHRVPRKAIGISIGAGLAVGLAVLAIFSAKAPGEHTLLAENLLRYTGNVKDLFFHRVGGLDRPAENIVLTLKTFLQVVAIALAGGIAGWAVPALRRRRWAWGCAGILAALVCMWLIWRFADVRLFQGSLVFALGIVIYFAIKDRRDPLLLLSAFVLLSAVRIPLKFYPVWFGFYLVAVAFPFLAYALGSRLASWIPGRRSVICALAALAILTMVRFHQSVSESYGKMTSTLVTPKGSIRDFPIGRTEAIEQFLAYIENRFPEEKPSMVVFPEGVSLNYYSGMSNPTAYYLFIPAEVNSPELEAQIIEELETSRPDYIAFTSRYMREFGVKGFGIDYGLRVAGWIDQNYSTERVFRGPVGTSWQIMLMRRARK